MALLGTYAQIHPHSLPLGLYLLFVEVLFVPVFWNMWWLLYVIDIMLQEEANATVWVLSSEKPMLSWKVGNAFHNQTFVSSNFSTGGSNFYHLVGCSRFLVHTNPLSGQKCIDIRSSAPLQISRKCRDTALLGAKKQTGMGIIWLPTQQRCRLIALGWNHFHKTQSFWTLPHSSWK